MSLDATPPAGLDAPSWSTLRALAGGVGAGAGDGPTSSDEAQQGLRQPPPHRPLRVLAVAREEITHWGLRGLLTAQPWIERYDAAFDAAQAREAARRRSPHVVVIEVRGDDASGLTLSAELSRHEPPLRVLLMAVGDGISPRLARSAGAIGIVSRSWSTRDLLASVQVAATGRTVFQEPPPPTGGVSDRERDIVRLIAGGATNREIGEALHLSHNTVKQHASALYRKLHARNRAEAVRRAERLGLIA